MKDDKKKIIVLGVLLVVMLAVGAFTFMGGGSSTPPVAADTVPGSDASGLVKVNPDGTTPGEHVVGTIEGELTEEGLPKNPLYAADLPQRDPFVSSIPGATDRRGFVSPPPPVSRPVRRSNQSNYSIAPFSPLPGNLGSAGGPVTLSASGPDPSRFGYTVSGVITGGGKPAAVFTDSSGNQRLVPVGGSLDGDSKVVSIDRSNVTIEHRGKTQRLSLGGNPK